MQSGKQTLRSLETALSRLRQEVQGLDQQVKESGEALVGLQRAQAGRFRRMAEIRLDNVISGQLADSLSDADTRAGALIRQRGQKLATLTRQIKAAEAQRVELEQQRDAAAQVTASATERLDKAEAEAQSQLESEPAYMAQLEVTRAAEKMAELAREKTQQARTTRRQKGVAYEQDPLFMYLWSVHYGTSAYRGWAVLRPLDDWVARLCGYQRARADYAALLEIPERLEAHAGRLQVQADEEFIALTRLETTEAARHGVPTMLENLEQAQAAQDALDDKIEMVEKELHTLSAEKSRFARGEDQDFRSALEILTGSLERERLLTLYDYARATASAEDDKLVREMEAAEDGLRAAVDELEDRKHVRDRVENRLRELENVRRRFKREQFDNVHSEFRNNSRLEATLTQFMVGAATAGELWNTLQRSQRYRRIRANPEFGSGDFLPRSGTWHSPFPGGRPGRRPRMGRIGHGGFRPGKPFRTGGGF